jgi:hypothetical protein
MLFGETNANDSNRKAPQWEPVGERELRLRKDGKRIVTVEECGRIIGRIISPIESDIFGPWRGAVYLARE